MSKQNRYCRRESTSDRHCHNIVGTNDNNNVAFRLAHGESDIGIDHKHSCHLLLFPVVACACLDELFSVGGAPRARRLQKMIAI